MDLDIDVLEIVDAGAADGDFVGIVEAGALDLGMFPGGLGGGEFRVNSFLGLWHAEIGKLVGS